MGEEPKIYRGQGALQRGRASIGNTTYFITCNLDLPLTGLTEEPVATALTAKLSELEGKALWQIRTFVIMPNHFHLLLTLGTDANLSAVMRLFKGGLTPLFRERNLRWQKNFYERRLRSGDPLAPVFLYIFLNPHRKSLLSPAQRWPWYFCSPADWEWFGGMTDQSLPFPEWLQ